MNYAHIPVMAKEVLDVFSPQKGESVLDVTLGLGGHAELFLKAIGDSGSLTGLDADKKNLDTAHLRLKAFSHTHFIHTNFGELPNLNLGTFDMIFGDLGVSSPHFDDPTRGFTFREDAPLDMRYDLTSGSTTAEWIAQMPEEEIARVLFHYGELKQSRKLAKSIKETLPTTTHQLVECVKLVTGYKAPSLLPQVFQSFRIVVNNELEALHTLLEVGPTLLNPGGRIGILSYHSLEDRLVKQTFKALSTAEKDDRTGQDKAPAPFVLVTKKALSPSEEEIAQNPRARSAKLRVLRKNS